MSPNYSISESYFPPGAFPIVTEFLSNNAAIVKVVKGRRTKFADFIPPNKKRPLPMVTINNNLNPYSFLITLLHEFAHYLVWKDGKIYAKPHGRSWKNHFSKLMQEVMDKGIFPESLLPLLDKHFENPKATSCSDSGLFRKLSAFDAEKEKDGVFIEDIPDGFSFQTPDGQMFRREKKLRKRILCTNHINKKKYLFSPIYRALPIKGKQYMIVFT